MRKRQFTGAISEISRKADRIKSVSFLRRALYAASVIFVFALSASAQTAAFTYQGRLTDGSLPANGTYNMQFSLFDMETGGAQIDMTQTMLAMVSNGIFTVKLNFGATAFNTANARFLEIAVKKTADVNYTTLAPRQEITSAPFAQRSNQAGQADSLSTACVGCVTNAQISSIAGSKVTGAVANATNAATADNASSLGGVGANQYVLTTDTRLSNSRAPTGAAGGSLTGTYPNPTIANGAVRGAQIADGSLGMHDIFVFTGSGFAVGSPLLIAANSCTHATLNLTNIFDVNEDDVVIVSMKGKPSGLVISPHTLNSNDNTNNLMAFEFCNVTSTNLVIAPTSVNRYMILRPGGSNRSEPDENSQPLRNIVLPPATIIPLPSKQK
ncbi:MAG TPA: hypothetical protein VF721_15760 [Pyrinomonadaceae bacterium]|jgi:hypothetical protein